MEQWLRNGWKITATACTNPIRNRGPYRTPALVPDEAPDEVCFETSSVIPTPSQHNWRTEYASYLGFKLNHENSVWKHPSGACIRSEELQLIMNKGDILMLLSSY